jgi:predicted dehydrogenase
MWRIAVIGAGQLGSRHLQGLAKLSFPCDLHVVDPSPESRALARKRYEELPHNPAIKKISFHGSVNSLPDTLDLAVVATSADVRLAAIRGLLEHSSLRYMVLEKVLFQRVVDLMEAGKLLEACGVSAWVNCPRRACAAYANVRHYFEGNEVLFFQVSGAGWGLGCNSIHFLDVLGWLTGTQPIEFSTAGLDAKVVPSKRDGFFEFTGSLQGSFASGASFQLTSVAGQPLRPLITIRSAASHCIIDEGAGRALYVDAERREEEAFVIPYVSDLTTQIATEILVHGRCGLSTFSESALYHVPLLDALAERAAAWLGTPSGLCPIT